MAWNLFAGQRVVFIGLPEGSQINPDFALPSVGTVYTLAAITVWPAGSIVNIGRLVRLDRDHVTVRLREYLPECWWAASAFRPLDERRLDQFRAHLVPAPRVVEPA